MKYLFLLLPALLFLFPAASFAGARAGLLLWFDSILPSLLPCLLLSDLCIRFGVVTIIAARLKNIGRILFGLSPFGCYPAFLGFLSGLPAGAKAASDLYLRGNISKEEAEYVITFCNNVSPIFLINYAASDQLGLPSFGYPLCAVIWLSSVLSGRLMLLIKRKGASPLVSQTCASVTAAETRTIIEETDEASLDSFYILIRTGGYIVLFSVLSRILLFTAGSGPAACALSGILETTTGIRAIADSAAPLSVKVPAVAAAAAFGGLSGFAQTVSVTARAGLSTGRYLVSRLLGALFAAAFAWIWYMTLG